MVLFAILGLQQNISAQPLPGSTEDYIRNTLLEIGYNEHDVNLLIINEGGTAPAAMDYMNGVLYISSNYLTRLQAEKDGHQLVKAILAHEMKHYYQLSYTRICNYYALHAENMLYVFQALTLMHNMYNIALSLSIANVGMRFYNKSTAHAYEFDADEHAAAQLQSSEPMIRALLALRKHVISQNNLQLLFEQEVKKQLNQPKNRLSQTSEERAKAQEDVHENLQNFTKKIKPIGEWVERASENTTVQNVAKTCYAPFSFVRKILKSHPTFRDRINTLIAYHKENFDTPLPDDLYEEIAQMGAPDYPGERMVQKVFRSFNTIVSVSQKAIFTMIFIAFIEKLQQKSQTDIYQTLQL
jgi:hypothetical protein